MSIEPQDLPDGAGVYLRCRDCERYRPRREFAADHRGRCRSCDPPIAEKRCRSCGHVKPIGEFHVDRHTVDGRRTECRSCRNSKFRDWHHNRRGRRKREGHNSDHLHRLIVSNWA